jgi:hypothetical protein
MTIKVPKNARGHFWNEPPPNHYEFWAFRNKPKCATGELITFYFDNQPVASIQEPHQAKCEQTGRFGSSWKVFWTPESFTKLS